MLENGGDEDEAIGALLHDGPEDCDGQATLTEIHERFGDRVAAIVLGCTDAMGSPKPPWRERKQIYIDHLPAADSSVHLVSLADKVHNVRSLVSEHRRVGARLWDRLSVGRDETLWYYRSLLRAFSSAHESRCAHLVAELQVALDQLAEQIATETV